MSEKIDRLGHALTLASLGFRIFPLRPGGKEPLAGFKWTKEATRDENRIREWWNTDPACNVGVALDRSTVVVDADTKGGKSGMASLEMLDLMGLPTSYRVSTPSGGMHVYLKVDEQFRNRVDSIEDYPGLDIRSDGGYVLGPGSVIDGKYYQVISDGAIEPAGTWFEDILRKNAPTHSLATSREPIVELDLPHHIDLAREYLANRAPEAVEGAGGDDATFKVAAQCRAFGLSEDKTLDVMLDHWNEQKAFPAWDPAALQEKVRNAYKYATGAWGGDTAAGEFEPVDLGDIGEAPAKSSKASKWVFETVADLRKLPPIKWLVEGWIPENATGIIYGSWGAGKSFFTFDLAFHLAYGFSHWHGATLPGEPKRVLVLAREGHQGFTARLDAFKRYRSIVDDQDRVVFMREPINFLKTEEFKDFLSALKAQEPFDLILVDTVARAIPGSDMSKPESITTFTERCADLTKATGATTIGVHHQNKGGSIFGSVYFEANSDFVYQVEKTGAKEGPLKQGTVFCSKMKDGEDGWRKHIRFEKIELGDTPEAGSSLVVAEISGTAGTSQMGEALAVIRNAYDPAGGGSGLSQHTRAKGANRYAPDHIARELRVDVGAAKSLMNELIKKGFVLEQQNSKTKSKFIAPAMSAIDFEEVDIGGDAAETEADEAE